MSRQEMSAEEKWAFDRLPPETRFAMADIDAFRLWFNSGMDSDVLVRCKEIASRVSGGRVMDDTVLDVLENG